MRKYYNLVISVLDRHENRVEAHEISSDNDKKAILEERVRLKKEIEAGKYNHLNRVWCTLCADIEVHNDCTWKLLEII